MQPSADYEIGQIVLSFHSDNYKLNVMVAVELSIFNRVQVRGSKWPVYTANL